MVESLVALVRAGRQFSDLRGARILAARTVTILPAGLGLSTWAWRAMRGAADRQLRSQVGSR